MRFMNLRLFRIIGCLCLFLFAMTSNALADGDPVRGSLLFNTTPSVHCVSCHTFESRQGFSATDISNAIKSISQMRFLAGLTATDIQDIAAYLNSAPVAVVPQTGWWWNPAEGGRGFTIEKQGNNMFMAGYLYDASGRARWYAAGPTAMNGSTFSSTLTTYLGGQTLNGAFRFTTGTIDSGAISIVFSDPSHASLTWAGGTVAIQRYDIVPQGASSAIPVGTPEAGWWWNSAEGGRGFSIEIQNGTMFLGGYMYDDAGNPIWYASGPTAMINTSTYQGTWQQYGNGQTLTGTFKPASVVNSNIGSVTINFSSTTSAILTLPNGTKIPLIRYLF